MDKGYINIENNKMASIGAMFNYIYHTKQLNLWPNKPSNYVVIYSWLSGYPRKMEPLKDHPALVDI